MLRAAYVGGGHACRVPCRVNRHLAEHASFVHCPQQHEYIPFPAVAEALASQIVLDD